MIVNSFIYKNNIPRVRLDLIDELLELDFGVIKSNLVEKCNDVLVTLIILIPTPSLQTAFLRVIAALSSVHSGKRPS